jgi:hypothetical protein
MVRDPSDTTVSDRDVGPPARHPGAIDHHATADQQVTIHRVSSASGLSASARLGAIARRYKGIGISRVRRGALDRSPF